MIELERWFMEGLINYLFEESFGVEEIHNRIQLRCYSTITEQKTSAKSS